ncbi:MAG: NAD(P)(+) transhydrogenase (Re/Si-specific) subunit alpha, partial [Legionellales bacterium]|nr:NAD(P)(+) transhydrogenase (Re/Si-specific) subunit alpha [Legionellales bacterium]
MASCIPATASDMYANNIVNVLKLLVTSPPTQLNWNHEDEIIRQSVLCLDGHILPFQTKPEESLHA